MDGDKNKNNLTDGGEEEVKDKSLTDTSIGHKSAGEMSADAFLMDKAKKLTGALYRVTDLYSDKEPLKWALRDRAMTVYTSVMSVTQPSFSLLRAGTSFDVIIDSINNIVHTL